MSDFVRPLGWAALLAWTVPVLALAQLPARLPWDVAQEPTVQPAISSLEMLEAFGIGKEQLGTFQDGRPIDEAQQTELLRILFRLPQFPPGRLHEWAPASWQPGELLQNPSAHRGETFLVTGRARQVQRLSVPRDSTLRLEFDHYYRIELSQSGSAPALLFTRRVPLAWSDGGELDEPVSAHALFLKTGEGRDALVFAADRVAWFPDRAGRARPGQVFLAGRGMDIGLFDDVRARNRKPMGGADRECFYQLLRTAESASDLLLQRADQPIEVGPLLQQPEQHHGDIVTVRGTVRRISRVEVADQDVRRRLGLQSYYQLDIFIPLHSQVIQFTSDDPSTQSPTFANNYPVTVCAAGLPPELQEGEDLRTEVSIPAVFLKLWAYRSRYVSSFDERQYQLSPMLIGGEPQLVPPAPSTQSKLPFALGVGFLAVLGAIWFILWRLNRGDRDYLRGRRVAGE